MDSLKDNPAFVELPLQEALYYYANNIPLVLEDEYRSCYKVGGCPDGNWDTDYGYNTVVCNPPLSMSPTEAVIPFQFPHEVGHTMEDDYMVSIYEGSRYFVDYTCMRLN